jgi:hypothetical protein
LENYNNIVIISADRNGSTAFQHNILGSNFNNDSLLWMGECFSQDSAKGQPPSWYDPAYTPKDVIQTVNVGTGKPVLIKVQITYPNFDKSYLDITAKRKIFFHRNLFDSTLSRCIAQITGKWWKHQESITDNVVRIAPDFFMSRLDWRIEQYQRHLDSVLEWANEVYRYETYSYLDDNIIKPNKNKKDVVENYNELYDLFNENTDIKKIEEKICLKII